MTSGALFDGVGQPPLNPDEDRVMLCGSPSMLKDFVSILDDLGFKETRGQNLGNYVIERAFVD
jgi:ferredoxin--NADP+ reductase